MHVMRPAAALLTIAAGLLVPARLSAFQEKEPIPDAAAQKEAEKLVRDVFREEYAKKSRADQETLAKKLLKEGIGTADDAPSRFVLLREARDIAAQIGDAELAIEAIDAMDHGFQIDGIPLKLAALGKAGKKSRTPTDHRVLAELYLKLVEEAVVADDFATALKAGKSAFSIAKRSKDMSLVGKAKARQKDVSEMKKDHEKARKSRAQLAEDPEDPAANLVVGRFLCLKKGDWERGLPLLRKCDDPALKDLAVSELENPNTGPEQMAIADGWWALSKKQKGIARKNLRQRAGHWYRRAVAGLSGLKKGKALKRLDEMAEDRVGEIWIDFTDAALFNLDGEKGSPIRVDATIGDGTLIQMHQFPRDDYDGVSVAFRFEPSGPGHAVVIFEPESRMVALDAFNDKLRIAKRKDGKWEDEIFKDHPIGRKHVVTILLRTGKYVVFLDDKKVATVDTTVTFLRGLHLQASHGPVTFERIQLKKKIK